MAPGRTYTLPALSTAKDYLTVPLQIPLPGTGEDDLAPDWEVTGALTLNLRAERGGGGRVYTITMEARDRSGNRSARTVAVSVRHNQ